MYILLIRRISPIIRGRDAFFFIDIIEFANCRRAHLESCPILNKLSAAAATEQKASNFLQ